MEKRDLDISQEQLDRLEDLKKLDLSAVKAAADADGGRLSLLYALSTESAGRFKNPIASIQLLEEFCNIDLLRTGEAVPLPDLYKMVYVLDNGQKALKPLIKANEKLRLYNKLDPNSKHIAIDEIAEAETDLLQKAGDYYETHFSNANQTELTNDLIESIGRIYSQWDQVEIVQKSKVKDKSNRLRPWSVTIANNVANMTGVDIEKILWEWPGEKVIAQFTEYLLQSGDASPKFLNEAQKKELINKVENG